MGLEVLDFLMKLEDGLPNVLGIQLMVVGELCDHHLVGVESAFHHPLALETCCSIASSLVSTLPVLLGPSTSWMCSTPSCVSMV